MGSLMGAKRCRYCNKRWSQGVITSTKYKFSFLDSILCFLAAEHLSYCIATKLLPFLTRGSWTSHPPQTLAFDCSYVQTLAHARPQTPIRIHINIVFSFTNKYPLIAPFHNIIPVRVQTRPSPSHHHPTHLITHHHDVIASSNPPPPPPPKLTPMQPPPP